MGIFSDPAIQMFRDIHAEILFGPVKNLKRNFNNQK